MPDRRVNVKITGDASNYQSTLARMAAATEAAEKKVDAASKRVETARQRERLATDQVRIAQMRLDEVRKKEKASASEVESRTLALSRAQERLRIRTDETATAVRNLGKAQEDFTRTQAANPKVFTAALERQVGDSGKTAGRTFAKQFQVEFRQRSVFIATAVGAALTAGAPIAIAGAALLFGGIGAVAGAQSDVVKKAWTDLGDEIAKGAGQDAEILIPHLTDMAGDLGRAFEDLRPQLRGAFEATAPLVGHVTAGLTGLVENALPGMTEALQRGAPVMRGFQSFLEDVGQGLGDMFGQMSTTSDAAGDAFARWGDIIGQLLPLVGELLSVGSEIARVTLPVITGGLWLVHGVLEVIGPLLPEIVAGFMALKGATMLGGAFRHMADGMTVAAQRAAELSYSMDGFSGTAAGKMSTGATKVSRAFNNMADNMGRASAGLPALGIVFAGISSQASDAASQEEAWAQAILQGGDAAEAAYQQYKNNTHFGQAIDEGVGLAASWGDAKKQAIELRDQMSPLAQSQLDATMAQASLQDIVGKYGATSLQAGDAASYLARKQDELNEKNAEAEVAAAIASGAILEIGRTAGLTNVQIVDAIAKIDDWKKAVAATAQDFIGPLDAYKTLLDEKTQAEQDQAQATADATSNSKDSWRDYMGSVKVTFSEYIAELDKQVAAQAQWQQNMLILAGRVSQGTLDELSRMGPEGAPLVADLVHRSDAELAHLEADFKKRSQNSTDAFAGVLVRAAPVLAALSAKAGQGTVDAITKKLAAGTITIEQIVIQYNLALAAGINPLLHALGQPQVTTNRARIQQNIRNNQVGIGTGGLAGGGYTGDGPKYQPAGEVHKGEFVFTKEQTSRAGVGSLYSMARALDGYAAGGFVTREDIPRPPSTAPSNPPISTVANATDQKGYNETTKWFDAHSQLYGGAFGVSRASPNGAGGLGPAAAAAREFVMRTFGVFNIGGYSYRNIAGTNTLSDHATGHAIDVMLTPDYNSPGKRQLGNRIASWFVANPGAYGTKYVIYYDQINSGRGWGPYGHPGGGRNDTLQHRDHVHVSFYQNGTPFVPKDGLAYLHQGERVVPREQNLRSREFSGVAGGFGGGRISIAPPIVRIYLDGQEWRGMARIEAEGVVVDSWNAYDQRLRS